MKLAYRGVSYKSNPPNLELIESEMGGKYRDANWKQKYPRHVAVPQPKVDMMYRGVSYDVGDPLDVEAVRLRRNYAANSTVAATNTDVPAESSRQQVLAKMNNVHINNIRRNLERRLQVAQEKGDENLIRLLEAEFKQLV